MNINPIQTEYNGYLFRSRLEARWAVFFDAAGIEYQYEPEGFIGCYDNAYYLPDFYLPQFGVYAEVKGSDEALLADSRKLESVIDCFATPVSRGLIILGDIPYSENGGFPYFSFLRWHKGVIVETALFDMWSTADGNNTNLYISDIDGYKQDITENTNLLDGSLYDLPIGAYCFYGNNIGDATTKPRYVYEWDTSIVKPSWYINECYKKARQARFEHRKGGSRNGQ